MKKKLIQNFKAHYATLIFIISLTVTNVQCDVNCCKKFECFECDSRYDSRCGEGFNLTKENAVTIPCTDYCVKLKHWYNKEYHYVRTCSTTIKEIYMKKTHVCYTTMTKDDGNLCFCDEDLCNNSQKVHCSLLNFQIFSYQQFIFLLVLTFYNFFI